MIGNTQGTRFKGTAKGDETQVGQRKQQAKQVGTQNAPTKPRFDNPETVTNLGFGTMLKVKFQALKEAIAQKDLSVYGGLKSSAKQEIRKERLNREEINATPKFTVGNFTDKRTAFLNNIRENDFATLSRQIGASVDECTVNGNFDPAAFRRQTRQALKELVYFDYTGISKEFLQKAVKTFEETAGIDPHRGLRKEATSILLQEVQRLEVPAMARDTFLDLAKEKVRNGDLNTFLRQNNAAAPLLFIARTHGGKELAENAKNLGLALKQDVHRLNEAMLRRREEEGDKSMLTKVSESINKFEAHDMVLVAKEMIGKFGTIEPKPELKQFLSEMVAEIRLAHPGDPKKAGTLINRLFCDQIFLRTIVPELTKAQAEGDKSSAGTIITDIIQIAANGMKGGMEKLASSEFLTVLQENGAALLTAVSDVLVNQFGMPPDAHIDYKPPRPERPAPPRPQNPPNQTQPIETGPIRQPINMDAILKAVDPNPVLTRMDKTEDDPGEIDASVEITLDDDVEDRKMDRLEERIRAEIDKKDK